MKLQFDIYQWVNITDARIYRQDYCIQWDGAIFEIIDGNIIYARWKFKIEFRDTDEDWAYQINKVYEVLQNPYLLYS